MSFTKNNRQNVWGHTIVFVHPSGGSLSIGNAQSVDAIDVVNDLVVVDVKQSKYLSHAKQTIHYPMSDDYGEIVNRAGFRKLLGDIDMIVSNGGDVHVVCAMGMSRSGTVVTNYVAGVLNIEFREALGLIRYAYGLASPNPGLYDQSQNAEKNLFEQVTPVAVTEKQLTVWHSGHLPAYMA